MPELTWGERLKIKRLSHKFAKQGKYEEGCAYWLFFKGILPKYSRIEAEEYWDITLEGNCDMCPVIDDCPVCIAEE